MSLPIRTHQSQSDRPASRLLARHPDVQQKLRAECQSLPCHQAGTLPTKDELKQMPYLRKVIDEGTGSISNIDLGRLLMLLS